MPAPELTPSQRAMRARIAGLSRASQPGYNPTEALAPARNAYWQKYEDAVDPTHTLTAHERTRRAKRAWSADMQRARYNRSRAHSQHKRPK